MRERVEAKRNRPWRERGRAWSCALAALGWLAVGSGAGASPLVTQTVVLHPGWNAVFLEVYPTDSAPAAVFDGLPVASVWRWYNSFTSAEFVQNPSELSLRSAGWLGYFPHADESFLTNLEAIFGSVPYLIKLEGTRDVTWTVTGRPRVRERRWVADELNLVGFPVDPASPPTLETVLAASPAHDGQPVYALSSQGVWTPVDPATTAASSGEAFWVMTDGTSRYQGPLKVQLPSSSGVEFGRLLEEVTLTLTNPSPVARTVSLTLSDADVVLVYRTFNASTGYFEWHDLSTMAPVSLASSGQALVRLGVRRERMASGLQESVLTVADDKGTRLRIPVSAEKVGN